MIITKKALSRRTVLRGLGVSLALPYARCDGAGADGGATRGEAGRSGTGSSTCRTAWR